MATYRLDPLVPSDQLIGYAAALRLLAESHAAALGSIPSVAADLLALKEATDGLEAADDAQRNLDLARDIVLSQRDKSLAQAAETYGRVRCWLPVLGRTPGEREILRRIQGRCPYPSALTARSAPAALEGLAAAAEDHPGLFARVGVGAAQVALLRDRKDALVAASDAYARAVRQSGEATGRRDQARAGLVTSARRIESYLVRLVGSETRAEMRTLRFHHLPRKSRGKARRGASEG